jgi:hypothetical protein
MNRGSQIRSETPQHSLVSTKRYPFPVHDIIGLPELINQRIRSGFEIWYFKHYAPGLITWKCCNRTLSSEKTIRAKVYTLSGFFEVNMLDSPRCKVCSHEKPFDGQEVAIINHNNFNLYTLELLLDILNIKIRDGTPTRAYWAAKIETFMLSSGGSTPLLSMSGRVSQV